MNDMVYYGYLSSSNALYHHGVKNQVWGVTNGPPYPLGREGKASFRANAKKLGSYEKREAKLNSKATHVKSMANLNKQIVNDKSSVKQLKANNRTAEQMARHRQAIEREQYKNQIAKLRNERNAPRHAQQAKREQYRQQEGARHAQQKMQRQQIKAQQRAQKEQIKNQQKMQKEQLKAKEREQKEQLKSQQKMQTEKIKAEQKAQAQQRKDEAKAEARANKTLAVSKKDGRLLNRNTIINSGDPKMLKRYGKYLNNEEYKLAAERVMQVNELKSAKLRSFVDKGKTIAEGAKNVADATEKGIQTWNNAMKILDRFIPKTDAFGKVVARKQIGVSEKKDYSKLLENEKAKQIYENLTKNPDAYRKGLMNQYLGIKDKDGNMVPLSSNTSVKAKGEIKVKSNSGSAVTPRTKSEPKTTSESGYKGVHNMTPLESRQYRTNTASKSINDLNKAMKELGSREEGKLFGKALREAKELAALRNAERIERENRDRALNELLKYGKSRGW